MNNIRTYILLAGSLFALASCNDFLDTIPDDRTEIDSEQKITNILVSAYPEVSTILRTRFRQCQRQRCVV